MTPSYVDGYLLNISYVNKAMSKIRQGLERIRRPVLLQATYLHHHNRFLHNITHAGRNELEEDIHTALCSTLDLDSSLADRFDALPDKVYVDF